MFDRFIPLLMLAWALPAAAVAHPGEDANERCFVSASDVAEGMEVLRRQGVVTREGLEMPARRFMEVDPDVSRSGEVVIVDLDVCPAGQDPSTCGYSVEGMFQGRPVYDLAYYGVHLMKRISGEVGDHIQIPIIFTDFQTPEFPGAYYQQIFNDLDGIGMEKFNHRFLYGKDPISSSLIGMISMNLWWSCAVAAQVDNQSDCGDEPPFATRYRSLLSIMAHEVGHRWGARLLFRNSSQGVSQELLGRSSSHWNFWLNTGGSPLEGNAWVDEGGGNFRVDYPPISRFSDFDLYAMGLKEKEEVEPTFFIRPEGCPAAYCDRTQGPSIPELGEYRARGARVEVTIDDVIAALGPRSARAADSSTIIRTAFVLARQKAGASSDSFGADDETAAKIERVRKAFSAYYYDVTDKRARLTTTLSGRDDYPHWEFTISPEGWSAEGGRSGPSAIGGMLALTSAGEGTTAAVNRQVELLASDYRSVSIRAVVPKSAKGGKLRLAFGGIGGELGEAAEIAARADGEVHEYVFDLRRVPSWKGTVGTISIGLKGASEGAVFAIDEVDFRSQAAEARGPAREGGGCAAQGGGPSAGASLWILAGAWSVSRRWARERFG